jgi:ABC-type branched-subunit amino acid transport system substrate-binding protein
VVYRIGLVIPFQGPGGLYGPSAMASTELAVQELNDDGGLLGRRVELQWIDGGRRPDEVAAEVGRALDEHRINAIAGWHISSVRNALVPVVAGRVPYSYPALYEGGEQRSGVYCTGEQPEAYLRPALEWFRDQLGVRRWFLIGDDYVWPRRVRRWLRERSAAMGITICAYQFVDYGRPDPVRLRRGLDAMQQSHCDGVLSLMIGQNSVSFNRAFGQLGLADRMVRLCPLADENVLMANGAGNNDGLYAVSGYFRTLATETALDFVGRYQGFHGLSAPALSGPAESCIESLDALAALVRRAGSSDVRGIDRVVDGASFTGPRGQVHFRGNQIVQPVYLGRSDGLEFDVVTEIQAA